MKLDEAIVHAREVAEEKRNDYERACALNVPSEGFCECAAEHEQLAEWLTELQDRREAVKKLEKATEYYKDSVFGDGIRFALKVIGEPRKRDWEREEGNG